MNAKRKINIFLGEWNKSTLMDLHHYYITVTETSVSGELEIEIRLFYYKFQWQKRNRRPTIQASKCFFSWNENFNIFGLENNKLTNTLVSIGDGFGHGNDMGIV